MSFHFPLSHEKHFLCFPAVSIIQLQPGSPMCLFSFCTDFLLPNKLCSSFTKIPAYSHSHIYDHRAPSPYLDVFPALPKTIYTTTASLKAFLTSPATLISATTYCSIRSISMFAITNHPLYVSMPHLFN